MSPHDVVHPLHYDVPFPATFTVIVFKISKAKLTNFPSGGAQTIVLATFSAPLIKDIIVMTMSFCQGSWNSRKKDGLGHQAYLEAYREQIMKAIEGCVLYSAIVLNVLRVSLQLDSGEEKVRDPSAITQR